MIEFTTQQHSAIAEAPSAPQEASRPPSVAGFFTRNKWWMLRLAALPFYVIAFATACFFLVRLVPGDPVLARLDTANGFTQEQYDQAAAQLGLDGSVFEQLIAFWSSLIVFDLGVSPVTGLGVWNEIIARLPQTVELVALGLLGAVTLAFTLALLSLRSNNIRVRRGLAFYGRLAGAIPDLAVAILGIVVFYLVLRVAPAPIGRTSPGLSAPVITGFPLADSVLAGQLEVTASIVAHYVMPVLVIVIVYTPNIWKQLALGIDEQAAAPPTLFKIASGATRPSIYLSILRRASASTVVMIGALFGGLVGGVVVLEQLFGFGGLGQYALNAVDNLDFLALQGFLVIVATLCLVVYFIVDVVNMALDPRRRPGARVD
ncbi:MAG: ABC transporter permease [Microbacterium sp.]|uniref:ABC transporter permease n=1 Tax=Microbacterium sp. TaxID=51671 RepID=UPI002724EC4E|nr:ABC transporter permease [Microbacterium sp.]MDO8383958.1 ABC transporter permease [Microbacterium sp.]